MEFENVKKMLSNLLSKIIRKNHKQVIKNGISQY